MEIDNIVIVNDFAFVNGGGAQIALKTAEILASKGHRVTFFSAVGPVDKRLEQAPNIDVICLGQYDILHDPNRLRAIKQGIWNSVARNKFRALLSNMNPASTIIHIQAITQALSSSIVCEAHKMGFKVVFHLHDYGSVCPNLGLFNYQKNQVCTLVPMGKQCVMTNCDRRAFAHKIWRVARQWTQRHMGGVPDYIDTFIYISEFSLKKMHPYLPRFSRLAFLRNIVDVSRLPRITAENNQYFVFIGRLSQEKGVELLAKASYDLNLPVMFIGAGESEEQIKKLNPNAVMKGWLTKSEIHTTLTEARAVVFTSRCYETQGLVVPESMAQGIPCLVSHNTAASDMVADGETGLLFETNNVEDLKQKLLMCADDNLIQRLSQNCYNEYWSAPYTVEEFYLSLMKIYIDTMMN